MEQKCNCQRQQIFGLKQESVNISAELKLRLAQAEGNTVWQHIVKCENTCILPFMTKLICKPVAEHLESEKQRFLQALQDTDILHQKKVSQNKLKSPNKPNIQKIP